VPQRYLLVDHDSVFILDCEIRFYQNEKFRVDHNIPDAHLLLNPLVAQNQLDVNRWQKVRATLLPRMDNCLLSCDRVDINAGVSRVNHSLVADFRNRVASKGI